MFFVFSAFALISTNSTDAFVASASRESFRLISLTIEFTSTAQKTSRHPTIKSLRSVPSSDLGLFEGDATVMGLVSCREVGDEGSRDGLDFDAFISSDARFFDESTDFDVILSSAVSLIFLVACIFSP